MLYIFLIFFNLLSSQDYKNLDTKNISPLLVNTNKSYNERIANNKSSVILNTLIDSNKYIVGPGDEFYISFSSNNFSFNNYLVISPMGDIIIPNIGIVNLHVLTLDEAYQKIKSKCNEKYDNSDVNVTLTDIRSFYINIKGLGYGNSKILVNPLTTVVDAFEIFLSTVPSDKKNKVSKRNILLNKVTKIDFLLNKITFENNPYLKEGDILTLSEYELYIDVYGAVMNPGRYEYYDGDNINDVITLCGGLLQDAGNSLTIDRLYEDEKINVNLGGSFTFNSYDHIVFNIDNSIIKRNLITINGSVNMPGQYILSENMKVSDLLEIAGGYTVDADTNKILINNKILKSNEDVELKRIKLIAPSKRTMSEISYLKSRSIIEKGVIKSDNYNMTKNIKSYELNIGDIVHIPPLVEYVEIIGAVVNPGRYPYIEGYTIKDYIEKSGGKNSKSTRTVFLINASNQRSKVKNSYSTIKNGEIIFVEPREDFNLWNKLQESMGLVGQLATLIAVLQSASNN